MFEDDTIAVAVQLFSRYGYDNVSLEEIRDAAHPLPGGEWLSKERILQQILREMPRITQTEAPVDAAQIAELLRVETPAEVLMRHIWIHDKQEEELACALYRFSIIESANPDVCRMAVRQLVHRPARRIQAALRALVSLGAIPPCDCWALAQLWTRTCFTYRMLSCHQDSFTSHQEFFLLCQLFIKMAVQGCPAHEWRSGPGGVESPVVHALDDRVLLCALELFERYGYDRVSLRQIERVCKTRQQYASKNDLTHALCADILGSHHRYRLGLSGGQRDAARIIQRLLGHGREFHSPALVRLYCFLNREQYSSEPLRETLEGSLYRCQYALSESLDNLSRRGTIPRCESMKIAAAVIFTRYTLILEAAIHPRRTRIVERKYYRIMAPVAGLILGGYNTRVVLQNNDKPA